MTIAAAQPNRYSYAGDGATLAFAYSSRFLADADLKVVVVTNATGAESAKTITTHYTVSGAGDAGGGTITMLTAPAVGETLVIYGDPVISQLVDPVNGDDLNVDATIEAPADKLTIIARRHKDRLDRTLRQPDGDTADMTALPAKVDRASQLLAFDASGNPIASAGTGGAPTSTFMATVLDDLTAADALTTLGVSAFSQTLLDDATASAALTTLGVSAFAKTLLDDVDATTARATLGVAASGTTRERLTASRNYYIATTGSDANDGLTVGAPWATFAHAHAVIRDTLDFNGWQVTVNVADGAYTETLALNGECTGQVYDSNYAYVGNVATPTSLSITNASVCISVWAGARVRVSGFYLISAGGYGLKVWENGRCEFGNLDFGPCTIGMQAAEGYLLGVSGCVISGGGDVFAVAEVGRATIDFGSGIYGLSGPPNFTTAFLNAGDTGCINIYTVVWSGTATGRSYLISNGGVITPATAKSAIPGNIQGVDAIAALVTRSVGQSIPSGAWTKVTNDTEMQDTNNNYDAAVNHRFTATDAGLYNIGINLNFTTSTAGCSLQCAIYKNGVLYLAGQARAPSTTGGFVSVPASPVYLAVGDYVEMWCFQDSGVAQTAGGSVGSFMSIVKIN